MLEIDYQQQLKTLFESSKLQVTMPREMLSLLTKHGATESTNDDGRRFVRFHFPGKAMLELTKTVPVVEQRGRMEQVVTKDLSRSGISFLYSEQIFPQEELTLWLPEGKKRFVAVRCRRLNSRCYEIGAKLN